MKKKQTFPSHSTRKHSSKKRRPWTPKEDTAITHLVNTLGTKQWTIVAQQLSARYSIKGRTGKQCRQRWHNHLNPGINKQAWSAQQELILFETHHKLGNKWAKISQFLPGRTDNSIKNHFYSTLRKHFRQVYGTDASREQLRIFDSELTNGILKQLQVQDSSETGLDYLEEVPELFDDCELLVKGFQIELPQFMEVSVYEEEAPAEFLWSDHPFYSNEVFMMPLT